MSIQRAPGTRPLFERPESTSLPEPPPETEVERLRRENETLREELTTLRPPPQRASGNPTFLDDDTDAYCGLV